MRYSMAWRYSDLTKEEKDKIGFPLPQEWEYGGDPGDKIWPIFICPICKERCESEWGGCEHLMFIYRGSGTDGFYDYLNDKFINSIKKHIVNIYHSEPDWTEDEFPTIHEPFIEVDGKEIYLENLAPKIHLIEFNGSYSFYDFVDYAGFNNMEKQMGTEQI
jgi:hypothetical protein